MTFPRRGMRPITVDGQQLQWRARHRLPNAGGDGELRITIAADAWPGRYLAVLIPARELWLDLAEAQDHPDEAYPIITPKLVAELIRKARTLGWPDGDRRRLRTLSFDPRSGMLQDQPVETG